MTVVAPAENMSIEEAEQLGYEVEDDAIWETIATLRPGMDFHDGVCYVTVPQQRKIVKTVKKVDRMEVIQSIRTITSKGETFWYDKDEVTKRGFIYPGTVVVPSITRWNIHSVKNFIDGNRVPVNPGTLYDTIRKTYVEYIEFNDELYYDLMTLFVMGSYLFRLFGAVPYVHFNGTMASGKSQNMRVLSALAFNTQWTANMSSPVLFRTLGGNPGVFCIDEAEGFDGERGEDLRRILNAGYLDGATVKRTEKGTDEKFLIMDFEVFGPKAIASINPMESVIQTRCIIVGMRPAIRNIPEFDTEDERWGRIRDRLYEWMLSQSQEVSALITSWNKETRYEKANDLKNRSWQISQMFVIMADYMEQYGGKTGLTSQVIDFLLEYYKKNLEQQNATDRVRILLRALPEVFRVKQPWGTSWYSVKDIHEVVSQYIEEDQKDYYKTRTVSKALETLNFKKRRAHKQGQQVWLDQEEVRKEIRNRRVDVADEDRQWLNEGVEYEVSEPQEYPAAIPFWDTEPDENGDE